MKADLIASAVIAGIVGLIALGIYCPVALGAVFGLLTLFLLYMIVRVVANDILGNP